MPPKAITLSIGLALSPASVLAIPFNTGDYICTRQAGVEIRAGIKIEHGADPLITLEANPPEKRSVLGRLQKGQCMVVISNSANGFQSGGYTWYNVHHPSLHGWTAGEFYTWSGNLLEPEPETDDSIISSWFKQQQQF